MSPSLTFDSVLMCAMQSYQQGDIDAFQLVAKVDALQPAMLASLFIKATSAGPKGDADGQHTTTTPLTLKQAPPSSEHPGDAKAGMAQEDHAASKQSFVTPVQALPSILAEFLPVALTQISSIKHSTAASGSNLTKEPAPAGVGNVIDTVDTGLIITPGVVANVVKAKLQETLQCCLTLQDARLLVVLPLLDNSRGETYTVTQGFIALRRCW